MLCINGEQFTAERGWMIVRDLGANQRPEEEKVYRLFVGIFPWIDKGYIYTRSNSKGFIVVAGISLVRIFVFLQEHEEKALRRSSCLGTIVCSLVSGDPSPCCSIPLASLYDNASSHYAVFCVAFYSMFDHPWVSSSLGGSAPPLNPPFLSLRPSLFFFLFLCPSFPKL